MIRVSSQCERHTPNKKTRRATPPEHTSPTVKILADCEGALGGCPKTAGLETFIFSLDVKLKCDAMMLAKQFHAFCCRIGGAPLPHHTSTSPPSIFWNFSNFAMQQLPNHSTFFQPCGYHSSPPDVCQFCSKSDNFFHGGSVGAM